MKGKTLLDHIATIVLTNSYWVCHNINSENLSQTPMFLGIAIPLAYLIVRTGCWVIEEWE
jgi:hypothetical protein